jgi:hypothetical protein
VRQRRARRVLDSQTATRFACVLRTTSALKRLKGMQAPVSRQSSNELMRTHPIAGLVPGWYFRCTEYSAGHFKVEGRDEWGRSVSRSGEDQDAVLSARAADAEQLSEAGR